MKSLGAPLSQDNVVFIYGSLLVVGALSHTSVKKTAEEGVICK